MNTIKPGVSAPVFVSGIKYPSLFVASIETAISTVSFFKAFKKSGGEPCKIKRNIVVLEAWVLKRVNLLKAVA
jgi:hypothetical protein